ncbi:MAG TPA: BON domain-containing protein [Chloroflexota bacterium]|nr:BON domain-containing protein [Chloroflexota bacterium]
MVTLEHGLRRDEELAQRIYQALLDLQPINVLALPNVRAAVEDGQVTLSGNVATASQAAAIRRAVRALPGVRAVASKLFDDGNLHLDVWEALAGAPELRGVDRRLRVVFGIVYVDWAVRSAELEETADRALGALPGVRHVVHGDWPEDEYRRGHAA